MPLKPGQALSHYRIYEQIGAGGMGEVYRAQDQRLERDVALKVLPSGTLADEAARKRFRKEALALSKLNHPNIATVHDFDTQDGIDFLVMEYVAGETLGEKLRTGPLPEKGIARLGQELAEGLAAAHAQGVIHRDLKPRNVRLTPDGRLKILDFGLAKLIQISSATSKTMTETSSMAGGEAAAGTLPYMAPEQLRGEPVDARSDLWAAGLVLYELATGRMAFVGAGSAQVIAAILNNAVPSPSGVNRQLSPGLDNIISKCLEKDPESRYQSARELAVDLRRLGTPRPGRDMKQTGRAQWRRGIVAAIGLALVVIALAVGLNVAGLRDRLWPPAVDARTLLILPIEVRGQVEGADYAGRSFAEEVAMNLTQGKGLTILPVPEPGELGEERGMAQVRAARRVRAGLVLTGALSREGGALRARLSLVGTAENRILWGAEQDSPEGDLSQLAVILSRKLLSHFGATGTRMYESHHSETPSPAVLATQEFVEARTGLRNITAPVQATGWLVKRFPDDPLVRVMRADALLQAAWGAPARSPKRRAFEESLADIDRVDRNNPWDDFFRALYYEAHDGKEREAVEEYTRLLARDDIAPSGRAQILIFLGQAKAGMDDFEGGIADLKEALRLTPAGDFPHVALSNILADQQRYEEAWALARQAVALNPTSQQNQYNLGWISLRMKKWGDALPALEKACQGIPSQQNCAGLAIALWRIGRKEEARRVAQRAASLPENIWGALDLGIYHAQAGNRSEALRHLHRYLEDMLTFSPREVRYLAEEPLLDPLHGDPDFEAIVAEARRRAQSQR